MALIEAWNSLSGSGLYEIVLPFLLVFAIVFALIDKADIFEKDAIPAIIALVFAFFTVQYFPLDEWIAGYAGAYGLLLVIFISILAAVAISGVTAGDYEKLVAAIMLIAVGYLVIVQEGLQTVYGQGWQTPIGTIPWATVLIIALAIGAMAWVVGIDFGGGGEER